MARALGAKRRILLVDDDQDITESMKIGLEHEGFEVDAYNDPSKALKNFKAKSYDGVLLDVRMEPISGPNLYRRMKRIDPEPRYFFFSAFEPDTLGDMATEVPFLKKPISLTGLSRRLATLEARAR
jgi:two-component system, OmpR family, response regulator ChvI